MLVQTKNPQVINAQTGRKEVVFFDIPSFMFDKYKKVWIFNVVSFWKKHNQEGREVRMMINETVAIIKKETFVKHFNDLTAEDLSMNDYKIAQLLIREIDFTNQYGGDPGYEVARYWDLKADDLINLHALVEG